MAFDLKRLAEESVDLIPALEASLTAAGQVDLLAPGPQEMSCGRWLQKDGRVTPTEGRANALLDEWLTVDAAASNTPQRLLNRVNEHLVEAMLSQPAAIPINPPPEEYQGQLRPRPAVDHTAELEAVIELCQSAAARAAGLLARLRGGGQ